MAKHCKSKTSPDGMKRKSLTRLIRFHVVNQEVLCTDKSSGSAGITGVAATLYLRKLDRTGEKNNGILNGRRGARSARPNGKISNNFVRDKLAKSFIIFKKNFETQNNRRGRRSPVAIFGRDRVKLHPARPRPERSPVSSGQPPSMLPSFDRGEIKVIQNGNGTILNAIKNPQIRDGARRRARGATGGRVVPGR